ncbi:hypothetical protein [Planomonospora algeriensis]
MSQEKQEKTARVDKNLRMLNAARRTAQALGADPNEPSDVAYELDQLVGKANLTTGELLALDEITEKLQAAPSE